MSQRKTKSDRDGLFRRPDSRYYWASYVDGSGKRVRRSTGIKATTEGRREAEALLSKWRLEAHMERQWDEQPSRTFDELMLAYMTEMQAMGKSTERHRWSLKKLYPFFTGSVLAELSAVDVRAYISRRRKDGVANATINKEVGMLSAAINYARKEWDWVLTNPASSRKQKEAEGRVRWITKTEANLLISHAQADDRPPYLADFIILALNTGCRREEMLGLEWSRVDLKEGLILLEAAHTKSRKRRSVPLNQAAREAITRRLQFKMRNGGCVDSPWVFCNYHGQRLLDLKKTWKTTCRRAGLSDFRVHDLRHTCAAWLVTGGVPLAEVRDLLGHSSITMTERYAHLSPDNVRTAVSVLDSMAQNEESSRVRGADLVTFTSR